MEKLEKEDVKGPYQDIVDWFFEADEVHLSQDADDATYFAQLDAIEPLEKLIQKYQPRIQNEDKHFLKESVLWGLVESKKLSKSAAESGVSYCDRFSDYMKGSI